MALYQEKLRPTIDEISALLAEAGDGTVELEVNAATSSSARKRKHNAVSADESLFQARAQLEVLRKGCCHPQVLDPSLTGGRPDPDSTDGPGHKLGGSSGPRPFNEIILCKVDQERVAAEERQRELLAHVCKMAGIHLLQHEHLSTQAPTSSNSAPYSSTTKLLWYCQQAIIAYLWALETIDANDNSTPLLSLAWASKNSYVSFTLDENKCHNSDPYLSTGRFISKEYSVPDAGNMLLSYLFHLKPGLGRPLASAGLVSGSSGATIRLPANGLYSLIHYANKRKILRVEVHTSLNTQFICQAISTLLSESSHHASDHPGTVTNNSDPRPQLHKRLQCILDHIKSSPTLVPIEPVAATPTSDRNDMSTVRLIIAFPSEVCLQVTHGTDNLGMDVACLSIPQPTPSLSNVEVACRVEGNHRSRTSKILVKSLHSQVLTIRSSSPSSSSSDSTAPSLVYEWMSLAAYINSLHTSTATGSSTTVEAVPCLLSMSVNLFESRLDVDSFQELHVCKNLAYAYQLYSAYLTPTSSLSPTTLVPNGTTPASSSTLPASSPALELATLKKTLGRHRIRLLNQPSPPPDIDLSTSGHNSDEFGAQNELFISEISRRAETIEKEV